MPFQPSKTKMLIQHFPDYVLSHFLLTVHKGNLLRHRDPQKLALQGHYMRQDQCT